MLIKALCPGGEGFAFSASARQCSTSAIRGRNAEGTVSWQRGSDLCVESQCVPALTRLPCLIISINGPTFTTLL